MRFSPQLTTFARWLILGCLLGVLCGAGSALFLWLLDLATHTRSMQPQLVYALPFAGFALGALYQRFGSAIKGGNNLVIDTLHDDGPELPARMAPMVLIGTVLTHLFGGSAGREGTAVQMGASLADFVAHRLRVDPPLRRQLLAAGIAGGFGAVFGTPAAGTVFALELTVPGRIEYRALVPALTAALVGDMTTRALGIVHTPYPQLAPLALTPLLVAKWLLFALAVGLVTLAFIALLHVLKQQGERLLPSLPWRMFAGGVLLVTLWRLSGTDDYLGLGVPTIVRAFSDPALSPFAFALKIVFTAVTLGAGFLGGEVTPLFFVGAALGNALAQVLALPLGMGAGVGLAAVFAAASHTPLALSVMAVELLGAAVLPHVLIVAVVANLITGQRSIYPAQRALPEP